MKGQWEEKQYGGEKLDLGIVTLTIDYDAAVSKGTPTGYRFYVGTVRSAKHWKNYNDAKEAGLRYVRKAFEKGLKVLDNAK